jgi:DivIVA domain-containing protein
MVDPASIRNASFTLTPTGYNPEEVDRFLGDLADDLAGAAPSDIRNASFSLTPTGYNPEEVDEYLSLVADALVAKPVADTGHEAPSAQVFEKQDEAAAEPAREQPVAVEQESEEQEHATVEAPAWVPDGAEDHGYEFEPVRAAAEPVESTFEALPEVQQVEIPQQQPEPAAVLSEAVWSERHEANLNGLGTAVDDAITALQSFVSGELTALREASALEVDDIHGERQRLIDEAADAGRRHLDDVRIHADRLIADAQAERERLRGEFEAELQEQRLRFEQELTTRRTQAEQEAGRILDDAERIRREAEAIQATAAQAQAQMLASFEQARNSLIEAAERTSSGSQFHVVSPEEANTSERDAADAA